MSFSTFVALGDSFTEGVGDHDPTRPHQVRGWADRVAEQLSLVSPDLRYANLAIRGRKTATVLDEQIEPALALGPDLVTLYAGGNDIMRPSVDLDTLVGDYAAAVSRLRAAGATLVLFTAYDVGRAPVMRLMRGRFATYNELVREVADDQGAVLVDFWRMREYDDPRYWGIDRIHLSPRGHARMAVAVLDALGAQHELIAPELPAPTLLSPGERREADRAWLRSYAVPWIHRRLTGRSSGDGLGPRYADPVWARDLMAPTTERRMRVADGPPEPRLRSGTI